MKKKKRQLRPSIRKALDIIELAFVTLFGTYAFIVMTLYVAGIDL